MPGAVVEYAVLAGFLFLGGTGHATTSTQAPPHIRYHSRAVLVGMSAVLTGGVHLFDMGPGKVGWVEGWRGRDESVSWTVRVDHKGTYELSSLLESSSEQCSITITIDRHPVTAKCGDAGWTRLHAGTVRLAAGTHSIVVTSSGAKPLSKLFSLEFITPGAAARLAAVARNESPSTRWMVNAGYGLMFHWTSQTMPRQGQPKSYCDAVRDFNVNKFADMVASMGAGFIVFTTSHAGFYFPGPNPVIDRVLPGRTCPRDLIGDLADALSRRRIRLELYFNPGHDDTGWWGRTHFDDPDKTAYFDLWCEIVAEIGKQYGNRLAGFWFDDAAFTYYPFNPSWERLARAARTGNPRRVLTFNSWILPRLTDFEDVYAGENPWWDAKYEYHQFLPVGGDGRYTGGPQAGLQAEINAIINDDWGHFKANEPISPPRMTADEIVPKMNDAMSRGEVPLLDVEVYQDGTISPETLRLFQAVRREVKRRAFWVAPISFPVSRQSRSGNRRCNHILVPGRAPRLEYRRVRKKTCEPTRASGRRILTSRT